MPTDAIFYSEISDFPLLQRGKVRDIYALDDQHLLIIASDRLSAFDVILPTPIPQKGAILNQVANFWFQYLADVIPNHLANSQLQDWLPDAALRERFAKRSMVVQKLQPLPIEAIVRGYIAGSGWKDYQCSGAICGIPLPRGLQQAERLPEPIYTPSSKAEVHEHDENIPFERTVELVGQRLAEQIREVSLTLYCRARDYAAERGIIIADTKFEFGLDAHNRLVLIDEVLTPDSSRFWPLDQYQVGISPPSFDKQFVRDYLETLDWNKTPPAPELPSTIVEQTAAKYQEAQQRLCT